jgi:hypothetical protein
MSMLKAMAGVIMKGIEEKKITKDMKKVKPCLVHGKQVISLKEEGGNPKSFKQMVKDYKELLKTS